MKFTKHILIFAAYIQLGISNSFSAPEFQGISAGDMTANSAILWTQVNNGGTATPLTLQVSQDSSFATGVSSFGASTVAENSFTSKTAVSGLSSNSQYYYRYTSGGVTSGTGSFYTTPTPNTLVPFKIGFTGDYDAQYRPYSALANFGSSLNPGSVGLKAFINLGDLMYEKSALGSPAVPSLAPKSSASAVDSAASSYYRKYLEGNSGVAADGSMSSSGTQGMSSMLASTGVYSLIDNHELNGAMISGGAAQTSSKENLDLSQAVNNTGSYINQTDAFKMMSKTFFDTHATGVQINGSAVGGYNFTNLSTPASPTVNSPSDTRSNGTAQNFFTRSWGQAATYIQLDDRSYRDARMGTDEISLSAQVANDPGRTMLGTTQLNWLQSQLLAAKNNSVWTVVSVSTPIDQWDPNDNKSWLAGYNYERNNLMKFIADNKIEHVVFLTTDDHMNRVTQLKYQPDPINHPSDWLPVPGAFQVLSAPAGAVGPYQNASAYGGFGISASQTVLDNQSIKQPDLNAMAVGLAGTKGLANVYRIGDPSATINPTPIDFFTATQFGYSTLEWDRFANIKVKYWGIDAYAPNSYPSTTPTPYLIMSFGVHVPYTIQQGSNVSLLPSDFADPEVPIATNQQFNSHWTVNGGLDISSLSGGMSFNGVSGASTGIISLGSNTLTLTDAADEFAGSINGSGGLKITRGILKLSGSNTYSGGTTVDASGGSEATLAITSSSALGSGSLALIGSSTIPATLATLSTMTINNPISVQGDPVFNVAPGTVTTVASQITNGLSSGDVVVDGGGVLALTAENTYTGLTTIRPASTLALSDAGTIAHSRSLVNSGTFDITAKSGAVSISSYAQSSTGTLATNISSNNVQGLRITGSASLAGNLVVNADGGTYHPGHYTLLSSGGLSGKFANFSSNLSSYTPYAYNLGYDVNDVFLTLYSFYLADTQQSLVNTSQALQSTFTLQNTVLSNSFSYDCTEFGVNNICISAGGRNTAVSAANGLNNTSALLIAAYRPHPNYRIGAYADQNLSMNNAGSTVNQSNNTPLVGLFGAWNEKLDGTGAEIKVSAAYGQKNTTVTRQVVNTSEPGTGSANLISQGAQITAKYGFAVMPEVIVSPYVGMRYTQNNMGGYTEAASSSVTAPLTYSALNTNATTALLGAGASYRFLPQAGVFASAGVETDTNTANGTYSATGVIGLTPINFNANPVKTRPTATLGAYYDIEKNQRLGITGIYRQEPYQAVQTTTVMATFTVGL